MLVRSVRRTIARSLAAAAVLAILACGGGNKTVDITWTANRESGVNKAGGGYQVSISGQPMIDVPYVSGATAPTSTTASLPSGTYTVTVSAYAALDAQGGTTRTVSAPSQSLTVNVP